MLLTQSQIKTKIDWIETELFKNKQTFNLFMLNLFNMFMCMLDAMLLSQSYY